MILDNYKIFSPYRSWLFLFILPICLELSSCNKQLDVQSSGHLASEQESWTTYEDARGGVVGMYGLVRAALRDNYRLYMYGDVRGGDFVATSRTDLNAIINNKLTASYDLLKDLSNWRPFYAGINACNLFIENSSKCLTDKRYTEQNNKVDIAEAKILRDYLYFLLVRNWGNVPFVLKSYEGDFPQVGQSEANEILSYLERDILENVNQLPWYYGTGANNANYEALLPGDYYGATNYQLQNSVFGRVQAYLVLAHIAAWEEHWDDVVSYTTYLTENIGAVGGNQMTTLVDFYAPIDQLTGTGYSGLFGQRGMWKTLIYFPTFWAYSEAGINGDGHIENLTIAYPIIPKALPDIYVNKDTINAMFTENTDRRFGIDTLTGKPNENYFVNFSSSIPIFKKILWQGNNGGDASGGSGTNFAWTSNIVWTRVEELMSLRAVALAVTEGNSSIEALNILNTLRKNRGLKLYTNGIDLIDELFNERRRELIGEGWRWYDIVTYKRIKRNDPMFNRLIDEGGIYWPVSTTALNANHNLKQNSFWVSNN